MRIVHVVGSDHSLLMADPVVRAFSRVRDVAQSVIHTGVAGPDGLQRNGVHGLRPDVELAIGDATPAVRTARIMIALEPVIRRLKPDWLFTVGAVNSTLAAAIVGSKLGVRVAHVGAGARYGDSALSEEINRALTDRVSSSLFAAERTSCNNLAHEGIPDDRIHFVGSVAIDALDGALTAARALGVPDMLGLEDPRFVLAYLRDPGRTDDAGRDSLVDRVEALNRAAIGCDCHVVAAVTPAVARRVRHLRLDDSAPAVEIIEAQGYVERIALLDSAGAVVSDRGGLQEEATVLGVPCVTLGALTASPVTVSEGTNRLLGDDLFQLTDVVRDALLTKRSPNRPELWDGHAAQRIADAIVYPNAGSD